MAAMTAAVNLQFTQGYKREFTTASHTSLRPETLEITLKPATGNKTVSRFEYTIKYTTEDADGIVLAEKVAAGGYFNVPINGLSADRDAALVLLRDFVASDEFGTLVTGLAYSGGLVT